jgi:hypothetical protein
MASLSKMSKYTQAGILLILFGLLFLGVEYTFGDSVLYLLPMCFFFSGFIAFTVDAMSTLKNLITKVVQGCFSTNSNTKLCFHTKLKRRLNYIIISK